VSKLKDRVVVLTGASSGIGRATALACAEQGATLVCVARNEDALADVVGQCNEYGGRTSAAAIDVTDADAMDDVARDTAGRHGRIDAWINNAGVHLFGPIEEVPVHLWHRVIEVNVFGTYHGIRAALPWMREQGHGTIVNVSSVLGKLGAPQQSAYVASKHAVRAVSDCTRQEVRDIPGIQVCTVLPGPIDTPLFQHAANFSGRKIVPISPVIDARRVADTIVRCAARPTRREVAVGASSSTNVLLGRTMPGLFERIVARAVERNHFAPEPAAASTGNLYDADREHTLVSGGWDRRGEQHGDDSPQAVSNDGSTADGSSAPTKAVATAATLGLAGAAAFTARKVLTR
jgi:NAD(P)-dependent dehydrogenase (short-subunit alcohol dehydrogenase family)